MFHWLCKIMTIPLNHKVYSIKEQLNLSLNEMNLSVDRKILFVSKSSLLSLNSRILESHFLISKTFQH